MTKFFSLPQIIAIFGLLTISANLKTVAVENTAAETRKMSASENASVKQLTELKRTGSYKQIGDAIKAIKANGHSLEYCLAVPRVSTSKSHNIQAITDFITRAIVVFPKSEQLYLCRAETWLEVDESELALPDIKHAIEMNPHSPEAHSDLAEFLRNQQKYKEAIVEVEKAISYGGPKHKLYDQKAEMLVQLFQLKEAEAAYKEAIKYSDATRVWLPRLHLARMYSSSKRYTEGLAEFSAMGGKDPKPEFRIEIATCLIGLGRHKEALNMLKAEFPEQYSLDSHRLKKQCYVALKDSAAAKREDEIIAKLSADF